MSACFEGLSDIQAVVTPTIDGLNGKQVCVCVCVRVYVVYEDTNLYNDMGMTEVLQFEGGL